MVDTAGKVYYTVYKYYEKQMNNSRKNVLAGTGAEPQYGQTKHGLV